jgi:hypothetical protein
MASTPHQQSISPHFNRWEWHNKSRPVAEGPMLHFLRAVFCTEKQLSARHHSILVSSCQESILDSHCSLMNKWAKANV